MKFYPRDWRGDQALRAVSLAARGLWIECLCIMHEAKPYGHLVLNGQQVEGATLARMTGVPVDEVTALMAELRQAGVLSMTGKGVVFSRRMTKDHARAQKGRKAANKRWSQTSDDVEQSDAPNGSAIGPPITHMPETRNQNVASQQRASDFPYDRLLAAAGKNGGHHPNLALGISPIVALIAKGYDLDADIIPAIEETSRPDIGSWNFFVRVIERRAAEKAAIKPKPQRPVQAIDWPAALRAFQSQGIWYEQRYGPRPGEPKCRVPPELLEDQAA
jgi:hypothetical protein